MAHRWGSVDPNLDRLTVLIGSGDCLFAPSSESPLKVGTSPTAVAIGDLDGDRVGDIAVANMGSDNVMTVPSIPFWLTTFSSALSDGAKFLKSGAVAAPFDESAIMAKLANMVQ